MVLRVRCRTGLRPAGQIGAALAGAGGDHLHQACGQGQRGLAVDHCRGGKDQGEVLVLADLLQHLLEAVQEGLRQLRLLVGQLLLVAHVVFLQLGHLLLVVLDLLVAQVFLHHRALGLDLVLDALDVVLQLVELALLVLQQALQLGLDRLPVRRVRQGFLQVDVTDLHRLRLRGHRRQHSQHRHATHDRRQPHS
jgi:hypothetical protein